MQHISRILINDNIGNGFLHSLLIKHSLGISLFWGESIFYNFAKIKFRPKWGTKLCTASYVRCENAFHNEKSFAAQTNNRIEIFLGDIIEIENGEVKWNI